MPHPHRHLGREWPDTGRSDGVACRETTGCCRGAREPPPAAVECSSSAPPSSANKEGPSPSLSSFSRKCGHWTTGPQGEEPGGTFWRPTGQRSDAKCKKTLNRSKCLLPLGLLQGPGIPPELGSEVLLSPRRAGRRALWPVMSLLAERWVRAWDCTCCPPPTARTGGHPGTHTGLPWGPAGPQHPDIPARQVAGPLQQLPLVTVVTRLLEWGEKPYFPQPSVAPCGLCQNLLSMGEVGSEGPAPHTGSGSVCVREGGVTLAAGELGAPRGMHGAGPGGSWDLVGFPLPKLHD